MLLNSAYYLAKQEWPFSDFSNLIKLQKKNKLPKIKNCYRNDHATGNFTHTIGEAIRTYIKRELANCKYFTYQAMVVQTVASQKRN